jgi:hypothetical protein
VSEAFFPRALWSSSGLGLPIDRQPSLGAWNLSGSSNSSWLARGRSASGASLSASINLHSGILPFCGVPAGTEDDRLRGHCHCCCPVPAHQSPPTALSQKVDNCPLVRQVCSQQQGAAAESSS